MIIIIRKTINARDNSTLKSVSKRTLSFAIWVVAMFFSLSLQAQTITPLPYFCGFEDASENAQWTLNPTATPTVVLPNKWFIGRAASQMGVNSLYISGDEGITNSYVTQKVTAVYAYREFTLPAGQTHTISFHYRSLGDNSCKLYVCWVPTSIRLNSITTGTLPLWVNSNQIEAITIEPGAEWKTTTGQIPQSPTAVTRRLVFIWANDPSTSSPIPPSAAIDNIQIVSGESTPPAFITSTVTNGTDVNVNWQGNSDRYELLYTKYGNSYSDTIKNISGTSQNILNLPKGVYEFWVRGVNPTTGEMTSWSFSEPLLVYDPSTYCLDYMNLDNAVCRTLKIQNGIPITPNYENDTRIIKTIGTVDYGFRNNRSQHTLHYLPDEKDPNTNYQLTTTPPDGSELAAVRLGGSYVTAPPGGAAEYTEGEDITYEMNITPGSKQILLLKYAVVLMDPNDETHTETGKPRFIIQILNRTGTTVLDERCGFIDFSAGVNTDGWHSTKQPDINGTIRDVYYKDWTTLGINLSEYSGRIKIRLMTSDCNLSGHYGYGYFTLNCQEATIEGVSCNGGGEDGVSAPIGFSYEWSPKYPDENEWWQSYNGGDYVVCTDRTFFPAKEDTCTYTCRLISLENEECELEIDVSLMPMLPHAAFTAFHMPDTCTNLVRINNSSYVMRGNDMTNQKPETFYWDFGEGAEPRTSRSSEDIIWVKYPQEGGTKTITLKTGMSNDECVDSIAFDLFVPAIGDRDTTIYRYICPNGGRTTVLGHTFRSAADTIMHTKTVAGCDSAVHVIVSEVEHKIIQIDTLICYGDSIYLDYEGRPWYLPGEYQTTLKAEGGCDSVTIKCTIQRMPEMKFNVTYGRSDEAPKSFDLIIEDITDGEGERTIIRDGDPTLSLKGLKPGTYQLTMIDSLGCEKTITYELNPPKVKCKIGDIGLVCGDDEYYYIPLEVIEGVLDFCEVSYSADAVAAGFPSQATRVLPDENNMLEMALPATTPPIPINEYEVNIYLEDLSYDEGQTLSTTFTLSYPSSIIAQKWNDVLAIYNEDYNNYGDNFDQFQWYKNDVPISDGTNPYIYLGEGNTFNGSDEYYVVLRRVSDGKTFRTCPFVPHMKATNNIAVYPSPARSGQTVQIRGIDEDASINIFGIAGEKVNIQMVSEEAMAFKAPAKQGLYIINIETKEQNMRLKLLVY